MTGSAPEPYQSTFFKAAMQTASSTRVGSAEEQFARDVKKMPELAKLVASKVADMESASPEAQQTAKMYLESVGRVDERIAAAGIKTTRPDAAPTVNTLIPQP